MTAMTYADFTLESAENLLGIRSEPGELFPGLASIPAPAWLDDMLARGMQLSLVSEKARSEFVVAPVLLAAREMSHGAVAIYSGQRLDVDSSRGLQGECDFILALTPPVPRLRAPLFSVVEAKKNDIELGLGQCIAQMVAARLFNEKAEHPFPVVYGCVTTGEAWQFLRLDGSRVVLERRRFYINAIGEILAALRTILVECGVSV
jgi:hypothetical protein